jgi:hypothetical protein
LFRFESDADHSPMTLPPPATEQMPPIAGTVPSGWNVATPFWDQLRRVRANVQGLQTSLVELRKAGSGFDRILTQESGLWAENARQVEQGITRAQTAVEAGATGADEIADELDLLGNDWDREKTYWQAFADGPPAEPAEREERLAQMATLLDAMVLRLAFLTIPGRVRAYLRDQRIGGAFDFHEAFKDELPLEQDRLAILRYLKGSPDTIDGVIDLSTGEIWATSPDPAVQRRTYLITGLIALVGLVATVAACQLNVGAPFLASRRDELAVAYVAVAIGVIVHIAIDLYKQSRSTDAKEWTAVDDLVLWGHAHQTEAYITAFSVWGGLIALAYIFAKVEPATAFIAGYSLDSFLDAALLRFSKSVEAGTEAIKKQVAAA